MLTLSSISISIIVYLVGDNAATYHSEGTAILALPRHLLMILIHLLLVLTSRESDDSAGTLHGTHCQLRKIVSIAVHGCVVGGASALVQSHLYLLLALLFVALISSTSLLHVG